MIQYSLLALLNIKESYIIISKIMKFENIIVLAQKYEKLNLFLKMF